VVIKELRRLATFTVMTGGYWYDIPQIWSTVEIIDSIAQATGRGANTVPLKLRRVEREHKYTDDSGAKKKKVSYDIQLEIRPDITAKLLESYDGAPFTFNLSGTSQPVLPELGSGELSESYGDDDDTIDAESTNLPAVVRTETDPEYEAARALSLMVKGKPTLLGDLTDEQLVYASTHGKAEQQSAARVILDHRSRVAQ
jgi:hypothetical protein